jgi:outer membrane protein TolC
MTASSRRYTPPVSIRLLIAIFLVPCSAAAAPLSLESAVDEALRGNLGLLAARYDALLAYDASAVAASVYEPRITASVQRSTDFIRNTGDLVDLGIPFASTIGSLGVTQPIPGGGSASLSYSQVAFDDKSASNPYEDTAALIVDVRQPLLSGAILGQRERAVADSTFGLGDAELDLHTVVSDLVLEIERAYWSLVQATQAVTAAELALEGASHQEAWINERIQLGFDPPSELLATQERVASAQAALTGSSAARANAEAQLLFLLGRDLGATRASLEPSTAPASFDVLAAEPALLAAFDRNLEARAARRTLLTARRSLRFTVLEQLPSLDASFTVRPDLDSDLAPWSVGLSLSTPLPMRGRVHGIMASRARVRQAEVRLARVEQRLRLQVETALRSVDTARAQVELAAVGLDVAQRKYEAESERLSRGRSTNKTVLDYLEDRDQAVRTRNDTLVALAQAAAQLRRLTGTNLEFWGVDPAALLQRRGELR